MTESPRTRLRRAPVGLVLLRAGAVALYVASVVVTLTAGVQQAGIALAFTGFVAFGELVRINVPGGRVQAPVGLSGALGYALLFQVEDVPAVQPVLQVVAVTGTGMILGGLPHVVAGRPPALDAVSGRLLVVAFAAALARPLIEQQDLGADGYGAWILLAGLLGVSALALLLEVTMAALLVVELTRAPFVATLRNESSATLAIGASVALTSVLVAQAVKVMGLWAIPVLSAPLLMTQLSFRRYAGIRSTYLETVRALSQVTYLAGYTQKHHATRVSELAVRVGRDMGMTEDELRDLEYAALMHDIGQLSLHDPIPGGATLRVSLEERRRIAEDGASVIEKTGVLKDVATIVRGQAEPYRWPGSDDDPGVPVASRIIKAVNAYDDIVGSSADPAAQLDALEQLRLGMAYEYDPHVVRSLTRVLHRQ